ncbi:methyltransferase domain-containing protein [Moorena sp. SIO3H5]|uniref:methyltransferase domain-containing protein n=1 Tax=Moorena sp. SIO3H5 TaxID=2607834 RepID=UPI0013B735E3|nr:methyltransferase domain-containing protein [Moorena sp. SIO3H5]NEO71341.1 methyltransferase domain-containing protein [Moorena sp. SIO3H5]
MNSHNSKNVFISWTGEFGKIIALYLRDDLLHYDSLNPWISDADITTGAPWFSETNRALERADFGIICLTPGSSKRPWINFEAGFIFGKLSNCKLVTFGEKLSNPLQQLQAIDGMKAEDWINLLEQMTERRRDECNAWVQMKFPEFEKLLRRIDQSPYAYLSEMDRAIGNIQDSVDRLKENKLACENVCFQQVILDSYLEIQKYSSKINKNYYVPAFQYPHYLISLQNKFNPIVKAIALVKVKEQFWQQSLGREILLTSNRNNIRVFVFASEEQLIEMLDTLQHHANRYRVYAMSRSRLSREFGPPYDQNFSIVDASNNKLLANYENIQGQEFICFTADQNIVDNYDKKLDEIISKAVFIPNINRNLRDVEIERLRNRMFNPNHLTDYDTRTIEMSLYIDIEDYDKHEEKHAYYKEMMERMISIFREHNHHNSEPCQVLEFGAGTGIFTDRLASIEEIEKIVAVEIDWHCYKKLNSKFRRKEGKVKILHQDSRTYDPDGVFDYIFSSFADHHIKIIDKEQYFENVKRNLKPNALMIVGDEFLPEHDSNDKSAREAALRNYHNHIIDLANQQQEFVLATLEQEALDSGLREIGDFKISCQQYEELLTNTGFEFKKEKIGPLDKSNVGGVYVYVAWLPT